MSIYVNLAAVLLGLFIIYFVFRNMVQKKISEKHGILWILIGIFIFIFGIFPNLLQGLADYLGIWYPPAILFAGAFILIILIVFYHTISISIMNNKNQELSMQVALLKKEMEELKNKQK